MAPEGSTLEESNRNLDEITDLALQLQTQTGIKVLWVTCNLFAHPRSVFYFENLASESWGFNSKFLPHLGFNLTVGPTLEIAIQNSVVGICARTPAILPLLLRQVHERRSHQPWLSRSGLRWCSGEEGARHRQEAGRRKLRYGSVVSEISTRSVSVITLPARCAIVSSVFWGGREGFLSVHNTDVAAELKHMASFFKMAVSKCAHECHGVDLSFGQDGSRLQFHVPCVSVARVQREDRAEVPVSYRAQAEGAVQTPVRLRWGDSHVIRWTRCFNVPVVFTRVTTPLCIQIDAMSVIGFLRHYGLESHFKLNIEPNHTTLAGHSYEHDIVMASAWDILTAPRHLT